MLSYETVDFIADLYIPTLLIIVLWSLFFGGQMASKWRHGVAQLLIGLLIAYGLMWIDNQLLLWPTLGMDYSTHTAVALILVMHLMHYQPRWRRMVITSLLVYLAVMYYQQYHTIADMVSTVLVIGGTYLLAMIAYRYRYGSLVVEGGR